MMDVTKIQGLDKKWQEQLLDAMTDYDKSKDKLKAIDKINEITGLGVLYSSEVFKKLRYFSRSSVIDLVKLSQYNDLENSPLLTTLAPHIV